MCVKYINPFNPHKKICKAGTIISSILQMKKHRNKLVKFFTQDHTASKQQRWDFNMFNSGAYNLNLHPLLNVNACVLSCFSHARLFATLCTVAHQPPLSMGFSRQEYWSGLSFPSPGDLPDPRIKPASLMSPALTGRFFTTSTTWEAIPTIPTENSTIPTILYLLKTPHLPLTPYSTLSSVQSLCHVQLFTTLWTTACQASLFITNSWSLLKLISIELVMPSSHLIFCRPLLLLPPIPPSFRAFSSESTLRMRWPKYWSFSFSISPSNEHPGLISFRMDWLDLLAVQGTLKSLLQHHLYEIDHQSRFDA